MRIGIDMDSVIADLMTPLIEFHNIHYKTSFTLQHHTTYDLREVWSCDYKETLERVSKFYDSEYFTNVIPMPGSIKGIQYLCQNHELLIITSRPTILEQKTEAWIQKHFPDTFSHIVLTNQYSKENTPSKTKAEVGKELGIELMIEDGLEFALNCSEAGIKVFLLDMPWNQVKSLPKNITRVHSWEQLVEKFMESELGLPVQK